MESKYKKIQIAKNEIIALSNRIIPVECDRIVILTSSGHYQKALDEVQLDYLEVSRCACHVR
jgi:hypothetical protein